MKTVFYPAVAVTAVLIAAHAQAGSVCAVQTPATATCREFNTMVAIDDREQPGGTGVACLQADNSWKIVSGTGFGSSFYRNDNLAVAYPGGSYIVNGVLYQQPTRIRYIVTRKSVCVPSMPVFAPGPFIWGYPYQYGYPAHYDYHTQKRMEPIDPTKATRPALP